MRTGGATDGTTPISWKLVTSTNAEWEFPLECPPIVVWNDIVGVPKTVTIEGIWGTGAVPNNDDIYMDVEYLGTSGFPLAVKATSTKTFGFAAGTPIPAGSGTWGGSTTKFAMSVTITPQEKGPITIYVKAVEAIVDVLRRSEAGDYMSREFATGGPLGATFVSDAGDRDFMSSTAFLVREPAVVVYGMKAWSGAEWAMKPVKVWTGSGWATKPVRHWTGSEWVPTPPVIGGVITVDAVGPGSWVVLAGVSLIKKLEAWGAGGGGYGGGGSGGAYARIENIVVTPGQTIYYNNSAGGIGGTSQPTDVWARLGVNAAPTTSADGVLADSGQNAHSADFVGMPGGQASASIGTVKYSGGTAGNSNAVDSGGGGGGAAGDHMDGGNAINAGSNHTGGFGGDDGGGDGGHGDIGGTQLQNGFAPGGGGGGSWVGTDANGAPGRIVITYGIA